MSEQFIPIEELPLRENTDLKDNIMVESLDNPAVPTSRSPISEIKRLFTGLITQESNGFPEGHEIYEQFEALKAAANNICSWNREISELCTMELNEFVQLNMIAALYCRLFRTFLLTLKKAMLQLMSSPTEIKIMPCRYLLVRQPALLLPGV